MTPAQMLTKFNAATAAAQDTTARGDALADYVVDIFSQLNGVSLYKKKVFSDDHSQEIDVIFWNDQMAGGDGVEFLSRILLVEAKNWDHPVGSAEVAWFKEKLRAGGDEFDGIILGILVAPKGVTGQPDVGFAAQIILNARSERIRLLVFSAAEIAVDAAALRLLIRNRIIELVGGRAGIA